jgi:hypothetical protein
MDQASFLPPATKLPRCLLNPCEKDRARSPQALCPVLRSRLRRKIGVFGYFQWVGRFFLPPFGLDWRRGVHPTQCSRSATGRCDTASLIVREVWFGDRGGWILKSSRRVEQPSCLLGRRRQAGYLPHFRVSSSRAIERAADTPHTRARAGGTPAFTEIPKAVPQRSQCQSFRGVLSRTSLHLAKETEVYEKPRRSFRLSLSVRNPASARVSTTGSEAEGELEKRRHHPDEKNGTEEACGSAVFVSKNRRVPHAFPFLEKGEGPVRS